MAVGRPRINDPLFEAIDARIRAGETRAEAVAAVAAQHGKKISSLNTQYSTWRNREGALRPPYVDRPHVDDPTDVIVKQLKAAWQDAKSRLAEIKAHRERLDADEARIRTSLEQIEGLARAAQIEPQDLDD